MTEYKVHRVRFVEFIPEAINCLAFEGCDPPRLAVSRQDGTIEIWSTTEKSRWSKDFVIPSRKGRSIESLTWCKSRLFSAGLEGDITEWDLERLVEKQTVDSNGGPVWSLAVNHKGNQIAAGCEDGAVRVFSIESHALEHAFVLDKQESRILSLTWSHCDSTIVTGSTDSTIQVYDVKSKRIISRITTDKIKDKSTVIWCVHLTKDMTIISGDSFGKTQFWDASIGTLLQSFKSHEADVLAICVSENEDTVYSSGIDSRMIEFQLSNIEGSDFGEWRQTKRIRMVDHDIRSIAMSKDHVVAGGVDPRLIKFSKGMFEHQKIKLISPFTLIPPCSVAPMTNLLLFPSKNIVHLWKLPLLGSDKANENSPVKLLELKSSRSCHITACDISSNGSLVAYADIEGLCAFKISFSSGAEVPDVNISKVRIPQNGLTGIQKIKIMGDGRIAFASHKGIGVLNIDSEDACVSFISKGIPGCAKGPWTLLAVNDKKTMVAAVNGQGNVFIYSIEDAKCIMKLPKSEDRPTAIAFQPTSNNLIQVSLKKKLQIFNVDTEKLNHWAEKLNEEGTLNPFPSKSSVFVHIAFNPEDPKEMFLQSEEGFVKIRIRVEDTKNERKRKHSDVDGVKSSSDVDGVKSCDNYFPLLHLDLTADKSLVVVERPFRDIISALPPALKVKKYGFGI